MTASLQSVQRMQQTLDAIATGLFLENLSEASHRSDIGVLVDEAKAHCSAVAVEIEIKMTTAAAQNERLVKLLEERRQVLMMLEQRVGKLTQFPLAVGVIVSDPRVDGSVEIQRGAQRLRVKWDSDVDTSLLMRGRQVLVNEYSNIVDCLGFERGGKVAVFEESLDGDRIIAADDMGQHGVYLRGAPLEKECLQIGDCVLIGSESDMALERLPRMDTKKFVVEEIPDVTYDDIGGLDHAFEEIHRAIELPYLERERYQRYQLRAPKGILLYGPPGCGKTMLAKAIANRLAGAHFFHIKGPEILNMYVGETECAIREIFLQARENACPDAPAVIFFDEMEALFRTRGSGLSSDIELTIVAQFLAELDGLEALQNVLVIGATNRLDLIDPAALRPGRIDVKIEIPRPDYKAAREIFVRYLSPDLPLAGVKNGDIARGIQVVDDMITAAVGQIYAEDDANLLYIPVIGDCDEMLVRRQYYRDIVSGALIENIVRRAKESALLRECAGGECGITKDDVLRAVREEFDTTAKLLGAVGENSVQEMRARQELVEERPDGSSAMVSRGQAKNMYLSMKDDAHPGTYV